MRLVGGVRHAVLFPPKREGDELAGGQRHAGQLFEGAGYGVPAGQLVREHRWLPRR